MRALKCDICGKLFEERSFPNITTQRQLEERKYLPVITIQIDEGYYGQRRLDLCDDCQRKLELWVNGGKDFVVSK